VERSLTTSAAHELASVLRTNSFLTRMTLRDRRYSEENYIFVGMMTV